MLSVSQLFASMISYQVYFHQPELHYVEVEMSVPVSQPGLAELYMPVWTPGSYMVREFSRHVDQLSVSDNHQKLHSVLKTEKNIWTFQAENSGTYLIRYRVYANELTVRTNHVDAEHAMLNGAPTFLTVRGYEQFPVQIIFHPHKSWEVISTSLKQGSNQWERFAENYDLLVDSPVEIGNHEVIAFEAGGISHELALVGPSNANTKKVVQDLKAIIEQEVKLFGKKHPCDYYLFILHHTENMYGGLEHLHSSLNMVPRWNYEPRDKYLQTISLLAHEYFHLWNVKRIRPVELGPFDYLKENYTRQLWTIEGVTSYYDDYFVYLAGVASENEYLNIVAENINKVVNTPGDTVQTLAESSFDAWVKYYRQHENTHNNQVNYYVKGATVVTALNLMILKETQGKKSLDDIMRALYGLYLSRPEQGYTEAEILAVCEQVTGISLKSFFEQHIFGTAPIDYAAYLVYAGLELKEKSSENYHFGWNLTHKDGKYIISKVDERGSAAFAGLNADDEVLAVNGFRINSQWERSMFGKGVGSEVEILVSRAGRVRAFTVKLLPNPKKNYFILKTNNPTKQQLEIREAWLKNKK